MSPTHAKVLAEMIRTAVSQWEGTFGPLPDNNVLESFGVNAPGGTSSPSVSDGVYLMTTPFSAGQHTIHFHAETPAFHFFLDITYHLNVASG